MRIIFFILILIFFSAGKSVFAQAVYQGQVRDSALKEVLPGVTVIVAGTSIGVISDEHGWVEIKNIPEGKQALIFSLIGYKKDTVWLDFISGHSKIDGHVYQIGRASCRERVCQYV